MAAVTAAMVKELREMTGAGMMDCKKALSAVDGDMDKQLRRPAVSQQRVWLRLWLTATRRLLSLKLTVRPTS